MKAKILVVDDERVLRTLMCDILQKQGYKTVEARDGQEGLEKFYSDEDIDIIILDVMMPKVDGWQVLREIRDISDIPIIMLTALDGIQSEVKGFQRGANDYISKPFSYEVLCARLNNIVETFSLNKEKELSYGILKIAERQHKVFVNENDVILNNKEYKLLLYLVKNRKVVLDRDKILVSVWGYDYDGTERTVDTHIKMLRAKLGEAGNYIKTIRGVGYCMDEEEGEA